jgi:predicted DNA-binding transcriptional regulator YafY
MLMRADRLLSLLLLLQTHGRMTAANLAAELEVSERTIYRDIDALGSAGVPVYGERGPDGGYALLDGYRTSLTGLTTDEMRAFFLLSIPQPMAALGVSQELKTVLLKLSAALPSTGRTEEDRVRQRFYLDATWWDQDDQASPYLQIVEDALWHDRRLFIEYVTFQGIVIEQIVAPLGLVAKAGVWYLVYEHNGRVRSRRVSQFRSVRSSGESFTRPAGFDLAAFWQQWCADYAKNRSFYKTTLRVSPAIVADLPRFLGAGARDALARVGAPDAAGWVTLEIAFESLEAARERVLACGGGVEVLQPLPLRLSVADFAAQTLSVYQL